MTLHAQRERLHAEEELLRVERRERRAEVAQHVDASANRERDVAQAREVAEDVPELQAVVALVGLGEERVAAAAPVEVAAVDDDAADGGAVPAEPLGERLDDDSGAVLDRAAQVRGPEGVVDDERDAELAARCGQRR